VLFAMHQSWMETGKSDRAFLPDELSFSGCATLAPPRDHGTLIQPHRVNLNLDPSTNNHRFANRMLSLSFLSMWFAPLRCGSW
jgi:hypothetical protein